MDYPYFKVTGYGSGGNVSVLVRQAEDGVPMSETDLVAVVENYLGGLPGVNSTAAVKVQVTETAV